MFAQLIALVPRRASRGLVQLRGFSSTLVSYNNSSEASAGGTEEAVKRPVSSAAHGTVLKGLNIYKEGKDPVALKDEEYPDWLWTLLDKVPEDQMAEGQKQRIQRAKNIKESNFMKSKKK